MCIVAMEQHLMEKVNGVLVMIMQEIKFLVLIIDHPLILIAKKMNFLILGERDTFGISRSFVGPEKK